MDFTIERYREFLEALLNKGFSFLRVCDYNSHRFHRLNGLRREESDFVDERVLILRQDVDRLPGNSLVFAHIQKEMGIRSTFYFRSVPQSFDARIIEEIVRMGHEVGYHYEDVSLTAKSFKFQVSGFKFRGKNLIEESIVKFTANLEKFRKIVPISSICMHGSPMSRWDSRLLWKYYDYREFGIECEPYFDINFEEMLYLTDTGRRWNGSGVSIRDKAEGRGRRAEGDGKEHRAQRSRLRDEETKRLRDEAEGEGSRQSAVGRRQKNVNMKPETSLSAGAQGAEMGNLKQFSDWKVKPVQGSLMNMTEKSSKFQARYNFRTTIDIIQAAENDELPEKMMMTFHPQRLTDRTVPWVKELIWQNAKNIAKYFLIKIRK